MPFVAHGALCRILFDRYFAFSIDNAFFSAYLCNVERTKPPHRQKTENNKKQNLQTSKHYNYETYQFIPRGTCLPPHIRHSLSR